MMRARTLAGVVVAALALAGCGDDGGGTPTIGDPAAVCASPTAFGSWLTGQADLDPEQVRAAADSGGDGCTSVYEQFCGDLALEAGEQLRRACGR